MDKLSCMFKRAHVGWGFTIEANNIEEIRKVMTPRLVNVNE